MSVTGVMPLAKKGPTAFIVQFEFEMLRKMLRIVSSKHRYYLAVGRAAADDI